MKTEHFKHDWYVGVQLSLVNACMRCILLFLPQIIKINICKKKVVPKSKITNYNCYNQAHNYRLEKEEKNEIE